MKLIGMAWTKVPPAHHPIFRDALPKAPGVTTFPMFGGVAAKVNGTFFAGLFSHSVMLNLSDADRRKALALDGAAPFDPMGKGTKSDKVQLPASMMDDIPELKAWIRRAYNFALKNPKRPTTRRPASAARRTPRT